MCIKSSFKLAENKQTENNSISTRSKFKLQSSALERDRLAMEEQKQAPHIVILPFPLSGHVKPMLNLTHLLSQSGFQITFINSEYNHRRLQNVADLPSLCNRNPNLEFHTLPDGLPLDHPRTGPSAVSIFFNTRTVMRPLFQELLLELKSSKQRPSPPTCIIADAMMCFAIDVGQQLGIPVLTFSTHSPCGLWAMMQVPNLLQAGEIPFPDEDMDKPIICISKMKSLLRRRDLPSHCRLQPDNPMMLFNTSEATAMVRASGLILNTFQELDAPFISSLKSFFSKIYAIGPLHALLKSHIKDSSSCVSSKSALGREDTSCMTWLDQQPRRSVIYASFGSFVQLSSTQLLEFWYGLVNSKKLFLWVLRPDLTAGEDGDAGLYKIPSELEAGTKERGCMVGWAPQEEVLAHPAVGGFLTHGGWNSILESIYEGVPMICWPTVADQLVSSRCVSDLWKIGLDMKDTCDRRIVEKMLRELMEEKREDFMRSTAEIAKKARDSVQIGGSSHHSFQILVNDLKSLNSNIIAS